jgi:hypothetical protein
MKKWGKKEDEKEINVQKKDRNMEERWDRNKGQRRWSDYFSSASVYRLHTLDWLEASLLRQARNDVVRWFRSGATKDHMHHTKQARLKDNW